MRKFDIWRDPYDGGYSLCRPKQITINDGLTVLVGCNGAGKTTLLLNIKEILQKEEIPYLSYDNLSDGGVNSRESLFHRGNISMVATMATSSEGENIIINMGIVSSEIREFICTGETRKSKEYSRLAELIRLDNDESIKEKKLSNERWILLDAIDSGLSIDNILELKHLFNLIIEDSKKANIDMHIIAVANEYEMANGEQCFDVNTGKYISFSGYEDYKKFVIKSRQKKDKRLSKHED